MPEQQNIECFMARNNKKTNNMILQESQTVEFKESWRDEFLKTVCAFANTDGGTLYIGINDQGEVVGVDNIKKLDDMQGSRSDIISNIFSS